MRVTEGYLQSSLVQNMSQGRSRLAAVNNALSTGMKVQAPSEDPVLADKLRRLDSQLVQLKDGLESAGDVSSRMQSAETALDDAADVFVRAYELCIQMDNDTYGAEERAAAADELSQLKESLLSMANSSVGGDYVFGGRNEDQAPFDAAGLFVGDTENREVELVGGMRIAATMTADEAFGGASGGVDVFAALDDAITALGSNDGAAIAGLADSMDAARDQLTAARAEVGCQMNLIARAESFADRLQDNMTLQRRDLIDTDVAEAATELTQAQNALQAAVSVGSQLLNSSVLQMLM